jgi:hypothetical protein
MASKTLDQWYVVELTENGQYVKMGVGFADKEDALKAMRKRTDDKEYTVAKIHQKTFKRKTVTKDLWCEVEKATA